MPGKFSSISLKIKITAIVCALFVFSLWSLTYSVERNLTRNMVGLLEVQQFSTVSYIASDLDEKMLQRIQLLNSAASLITPQILADPAKARQFLESRLALHSLFKAGLSLVSKDGIGITDFPPMQGRAHGSFRETEHYREVLATGKTAIGKPGIGSFSRKPGIAIAAPIKDKSGRLIGLLVGFDTFSDSTLFGQVQRAKVGKSGYITVNVPKYNLIATSSDPERIFQPLASPGVNRMPDRFLAGYEGTGIAVDSRGIETLTSAKSIPSTGWMVQMVLPTAEVFAPIRSMKLQADAIALALTIFALLSIWLAIGHLLNPLLVASRKLEEMSAGGHAPLPVNSRDEIGKLLTNFNLVVSDREQAYQALRESEAGFRNILENAPIGMAVVSIEGAFLLVNRALCAIVGYEKQELEKMTFQEITYPDDLDAYLANLQRLLTGKVDSFQIEKRYIRKDHQVQWIQLTDSLQRDASGTALYFIKQIEDITERKRSREQIQQLAYYDALTKLPNRRLLKDRLNQALAQAKRFERPLAVMFLDLDHFKEVNDTLGHDGGDQMLKVIAGRLLSCVRSVDTVCRQGGDEFIIVLVEITDPQDAARVAEKIIKSVHEPISIHKTKMQVTTSIGIAIFPVNGNDDARKLMKEADMAMYHAKTRGRNRFCIFGSEPAGE